MDDNFKRGALSLARLLDDAGVPRSSMVKSLLELGVCDQEIKKTFSHPTKTDSMLQESLQRLDGMSKHEFEKEIERASK